jgi:hypothetical protein
MFRTATAIRLADLVVAGREEGSEQVQPAM